MALVDFSTVSDGTNADLVDPMTTSLMDLGIQPQSLDAVTDADLAGIGEEQIPEFLDRAELRLLESIAGNIDLVSISVGPRKEELGELADQIEKAIDRMITKITRTYGAPYNAFGDFAGGTLTLDFQEKETE